MILQPSIDKATTKHHYISFEAENILFKMTKKIILACLGIELSGFKVDPILLKDFD